MLYHEDEHPVKRVLTESEVSFLNDLQKEMNTQDHLATADPRFWVIKDIKRYAGKRMENNDGYILRGDLGFGEQYIAEGTTIEHCINAAIDCISDAEYLEDTDIKIDLSDMPEDAKIDEDAFCDYLKTNGVKNPHFVEFIEITVTSQVFFSQRDAENYLKKFHYHFTKKAYIYCDCGLYNDELKQLIDILHIADFNKLLNTKGK